MGNVCYDDGMTKTDSATALLAYALAVDGDWAVHTADCSCLVLGAAQQLYQEEPTLFRAATVEQVLDEVLVDELREMGYDESAVTVHTCVDIALQLLAAGTPVAATLHLTPADPYAAERYRQVAVSRETVEIVGPRIHNNGRHHKLTVWADPNCTGGRGTHTFSPQVSVIARQPVKNPPRAGTVREGDVVEVIELDGTRTLWTVTVTGWATDPVLKPKPLTG